MPVNKNAYLRYQILDQCFSNKHRRFNIDDLVDFVSEKLGYKISLRQIREDIANLRLSPYHGTDPRTAIRWKEVLLPLF